MVEPQNNSEFIPSVIVTWGINPLGEYTFARVPRTRDDAIAEGYELQASGCEGINTIIFFFFSLLLPNGHILFFMNHFNIMS